MQEKQHDSDNMVNVTVNQMLILELNRAGYDNQSIAEAIDVSLDTVRILRSGKPKQPKLKIAARLLRYYYACLFRDIEMHDVQISLDNPASLHSLANNISGKKDQGKKNFYVPLQERKSYYLGEPYDGVYFTQRELDCVSYLVQGRTIPATAKMLGLSARTVEFYVNNMKIKIGVRNKKELLRRVLKSDLIKHIDI